MTFCPLLAQPKVNRLALDKQGTMVVIENKTDDSRKDVSWQALKYASYCSRLKESNITEIYQEFLDKSGCDDKAKELISDFMDDQKFEKIRINEVHHNGSFFSFAI